MRRLILCLLSTFFLSGVGCRTTEPAGLWYGPHRELEMQRAQAQVVDPYPLNESGPEVVGGRPRDFQIPRPETQRIQPDRWIKFGGY